MTKKLILHIGMWKTGTSAIQHCLAKSRDVLKERGIIYPETGGLQNQQGRIALMCHQRSTEPESALRDLSDAFRREVEPYPIVLVSSEGFQNVVRFSRMMTFFSHGQAQPPYDITVVCYVREFLDTARSGYAQKVLASDLSVSFERYCATYSKFDLARFFARWQQLSPTMKILSYERALAEDRSVVPGLWRLLDSDLAIPTEDEPRGSSISGNLLVFKALINKLGLHNPDVIRALGRVALTDVRYHGAFRIDPDLAARLRAAYSRYNQVLETQVGRITMRDVSQGKIVFEPERWRDDVERFLAEQELAHLRGNQAFNEPPVQLVRELFG
jgi:hypothetical protein